MCYLITEIPGMQRARHCCARDPSHTNAAHEHRNAGPERPLWPQGSPTQVCVSVCVKCQSKTRSFPACEWLCSTLPLHSYRQKPPVAAHVVSLVVQGKSTLRPVATSQRSARWRALNTHRSDHTRHTLNRMGMQRITSALQHAVALAKPVLACILEAQAHHAKAWHSHGSQQTTLSKQPLPQQASKQASMPVSLNIMLAGSPCKLTPRLRLSFLI